MKNVLTLLCIVTVFSNGIVAQYFSEFKDSIKEEFLRKEVAFLCDPGLSGRKIASTGEKKAAEYIREQFIKSGLHGKNGEVSNFFQDFCLTYDSLVSFRISNNKATLDYISDFISFEFYFLHDTPDVELVYAGFGLDREDYSDYKNLNVKNKWVVVEMNSPVDSAGNLMEHMDFNQSVNLHGMQEKKQIAQNNGARGIIFKINSQKYIPEVVSHVIFDRIIYGTSENTALNLELGTFPGIIARAGKMDSLMGVNTNEFNMLVNSLLKNKQSAAGMAGTRVSFKVKKNYVKFNSQNIIGVIKGIDEKVGVILSAHYDAVKEMDSLDYPGANDNASGTVAVLQLSDVFSKMVTTGYIPEKSIAFVLFSGEEEGIVGSTYFMKHVPFLMDSSTVDINFDCVGILDTVEFKNGRMGIAAPEKILNRYRKIFTEINEREEQPIYLYFNQFYQYSDNASFTYAGFPAMHITTGGGEVMRTPLDKPELFEYNNYVNVIRLIFDFVMAQDKFVTK